MMPTIQNQILVLSYLSFLLSCLNINFWFVFSIKMILYYSKFLSSKSYWFTNTFSESEIKTTYLPLGITCEKVFRILMTAWYQRNSLFSFTRDCKVWKFFQKLLLSFLKTILVSSLSIFILLDSSYDSIMDLFHGLFLIILSKFKYFLSRNRLILLSFKHYLSCVIKKRVLCSFKDFTLKFIDWFARKNLFFKCAYQRQASIE